ncbi:histone deacetylase 6 isoform X3 [Alligator sinensis]|uniref:Protein deacetylase HDAC6 n=1 Tax=Alligator sinensis TaxID=38654 RepID=A0A3Q0HG36_ALLSI|nr:histone deacetylase 6 isoform X3 [Alligator sinensis]
MVSPTPPSAHVQGNCVAQPRLPRAVRMVSLRAGQSDSIRQRPGETIFLKGGEQVKPFPPHPDLQPLTPTCNPPCLAAAMPPGVSPGPEGPSAPAPSGRAGRRAPPPPRRSPGLPEAKRRGRARRLHQEVAELQDGLQHLDLAAEKPVPSGTGLAYDKELTSFHCLWDKSFPECPARLTSIWTKLVEDGLVERCVPVQARLATEEEILLVHSPQFLALMASTADMEEGKLRALSDTYDSVYLHPNSYHCARLAAGTVLAVVDKVLSGELRNGLALIRPPGHHAQRERMEGYCLFNHVAIAARHARERRGLQRVLIVDWDVHHGQGTQFIFEDDPRVSYNTPSVLYFSVHRYDNGAFWPHLPDSDSSAVGRGQGCGFTINLPWNQPGMTDADYISAFLQLLLPVAFEGQMLVSPACFAHLTHMLLALAGGKVVLALEGGYNLHSLTEGVSAALGSLLGDPCPPLAGPAAPCPSALQSISKALGIHAQFWPSLQHVEVSALSTEDEGVEEALGETGGVPSPVELPCPEALPSLEAPPPRRPPACTGLVYDERMTQHYNMWDSQHPERPQRVTRALSRLQELGLERRCLRLPPRLATEPELLLCHSPEYVARLRATVGLRPRELHRAGSRYNSVYMCGESFEAACLAAGCVLSAVDAVLAGQVQNAVAVVRPPGHHAEPDAACGFCLFNSVALAARYAQQVAGRPLRVLILDWDIHHGNGIQHIFEEDPSVLYISLHRYDAGAFFPGGPAGGAGQVGRGQGRGYTLNVPWEEPRAGDLEYLPALLRLCLPVAYQFRPELVLVAAGFDAAQGDPLGGCLVTPQGYGTMAWLLATLACGRLILALEGGYNLAATAESLATCVRALLGDPPLAPPPVLALPLSPHPQPSALHALSLASAVHRTYWACLRLHVPSMDCDASEDRSPAPQEALPPDDLSSLGSLSLEDRSQEGMGSPDSVPVGWTRRKMKTEPELEGVGINPEGEEGPPEGAGLAAPDLPEDALYAVTPLSWCPHLSSVAPVPPAGLDILAPCQKCGCQGENWVCLTCYQVLCSRYVAGHMVAHGDASGHPMVLSFADLSAWCYDCEAYIHHPTLLPAKILAHRLKFGNELPALL